MSSYIVTASTSVVLIDSAALTAGQSAVVLLSSQVPPGRTVTVRDSAGFLSTPQSLIVSTTSGVAFADGTSSFRTSDAFTSLSFSSRDATSWNIINTFGFPLNNTIANVRQLTASTLAGNSISISGNLSTNGINANSFLANSTSQVLGSAFASTLIVGTQPNISIPYETTPGYAAYVVGATQITSNLAVGGNLTVGGAAQFNSSFTVTGGLGVAQGLTVGGNLTIQGDLLTTGNGLITANSANIQSSLTVFGPATINNNAVVNSTLQVTGATTASIVSASTVQINTGVGGYLQLGVGGGPILTTSATLLPGQTVAAWNSPLYTPFLSSQTIQTTATATVQNLTVLSTIAATSVSQVLMSAAQILNPAGSLLVNTISANTITLSNIFAAPAINTALLTTSTATVSGSITGTSPLSFLSAASVIASTVITSQFSTGSIIAGVIQTPSVRVSSLTVAQTIDGPTLSLVNMPSTIINNSQGLFQTSSIFTTALTTSTLSIESGLIQSSSNINIQASNVIFGTAYVSSLTASTLQTSTITATRIQIGQPLATNARGPDFFYTATPAASTNVLVTGGPGDYLSPFFLSNVRPVGQNPAVPYSTFITFQADYKSSPPPPGMVVSYTATLFWASQTGSQLAITGGPTLFGSLGADQTITSTTTQSSFQIVAGLLGNSAISVNFGFQYNPNFNSIDSNAVIDMNNGILRWNYALNGTTIQNSLNDINTRNLYYYGSLSFASDPVLKEDVQDADLARCYETIRSIPLRRYKYIDAYCSTFHVEDSHRLGFLATDLLPHFPKSVKASDTLFPEFSTTLLTVDTQQVDMAHLGATKYLLKKVEELEGILKRLEA